MKLLITSISFIALAAVGLTRFTYSQTTEDLESLVKNIVDNFDAQEFIESIDTTLFTRFSIIPLEVKATENGLGLIWTRKFYNSFDAAEIEALKAISETPVEMMEGYCTEIPMKIMEELGYSIREILIVNNGEVVRDFLVNFESCSDYLKIMNINI